MDEMLVYGEAQNNNTALFEEAIRAKQEVATRIEWLLKTERALNDALTFELADGDMEQEMARRIFNSVSTKLSAYWDNPFKTTYLVKVFLDSDEVLEVQVEAEDESEAQDEVEQNITFDDLQITGSISWNTDSSQFECELSSYDYDIESRLTYRVSEVE